MTTTYDVSTDTPIDSHFPMGSSIRLAFMALRSTKLGRLVITLPDGRMFRFDHGLPGPRADIRIIDEKLFSRVLSAGDIGFAEAYMDGQFETPDLTAVLEFFAVNFDQAGQLSRGHSLLNGARLLLNALTRQNTRNGSKQNILAHYDLGNDFYKLWLDPSMTYSAALYSAADSLEDAQQEKYRAIAEKAGAAPGKTILEIGCGWGGFAEFAASNYGCKVHALTISDAQFDYAKRRIANAGLTDLVTIDLCDYRDVQGQYDGVVSIEMFEAVGEAFWPTYFSKIHEALKPGGKAALQIITIDDELFPRYRKRVDFIQKYIFPGGMLPSISALKGVVESAKLEFGEFDMFGEGYARTLNEWNTRFHDAWIDIRQQGFDDRFKKLWDYYLSYCEAGFKTGRTDVGHFMLTKPE